jgi:hypothetical protein
MTYSMRQYNYCKKYNYCSASSAGAKVRAAVRLCCSVDAAKQNHDAYLQDVTGLACHVSVRPQPIAVSMYSTVLLSSLTHYIGQQKLIRSQQCTSRAALAYAWLLHTRVIACVSDVCVAVLHRDCGEQCQHVITRVLHL